MSAQLPPVLVLHVQSKTEFMVHVLDTPTGESWEHVVHVVSTNVSCVSSQFR